jgi:hypothetical protein
MVAISHFNQARSAAGEANTMGDALGGIEDIMREKKRIKEKARATAAVGFGKLTGLMDRIEKKITTDLVSNITEKKVLAEIKRA